MRRAGRRILPAPAVRVAAVLVMAVGGCGEIDPPLPAAAVLPEPRVAAPDVPGLSAEFEQMEVPPGQLTRALPTGRAWPRKSGPLYRSLCLQCHSVSQTSFAVADWRESAHARAGVTCSSCHGTHEAGFRPQPSAERCTMCHPQQAEEFLASAHGPDRAPGMRCVSCHEAHATDRRIVAAVSLCAGCHLDSEHVQGFGASRMGVVLAGRPPGDTGELRAPDCVYCHQSESDRAPFTGSFRNDRVTLHDPASTVARHAKDDRRLADETVEKLLPLCVNCHSDRNSRHRLDNSDPLIRTWAPLGMAAEVRRRPSPEAVP